MADGQQTSFSHDPVMRDEIVDVFAEVPPGTILDATLGGGGHSEALLEARDDVDVIGLDRTLRPYRGGTAPRTLWTAIPLDHASI